MAPDSVDEKPPPRLEPLKLALTLLLLLFLPLAWPAPMLAALRKLPSPAALPVVGHLWAMRKLLFGIEIGWHLEKGSTAFARVAEQFESIPFRRWQLAFDRFFLVCIG